MDRKAEEARAGERKIVIILSDRSREIIRLFEERQRKRQQADQNRQSNSVSGFPQIENSRSPHLKPPCGAASSAAGRKDIIDN
jgi:hypothetical protein